MLKLDTPFTRRKEKAKERLDICKECDHYVALTTQCKECWCFMSAKTMWPSAECPLGKWKAEMTQEEEDQLNQKLGI